MIGLIGGLCYTVIENGLVGVWIWCCGVFVPVVLLFLLFYIRALGAGDIKLFSVLGGLFGLNFVLKVILISFCIGAILSIIQMIRYGNFLIRLHILAKYIIEILEKKKIGKYYLPERDGNHCVIHFTTAVLIGTIVCFLNVE